MAVNLEPAPYRNALVTQDGLMTAPWIRWNELSLVQRVQQSTAVIQHQASFSGAASVPLTPIIPSASGYYRVMYFAIILQAATTSSSLSVSIAGTIVAVPYLVTSPALTANTFGATLSGSVMIVSDAGSPISYATTYASVGASPMGYSLQLTLEQVG